MIQAEGRRGNLLPPAAAADNGLARPADYSTGLVK